MGPPRTGLRVQRAASTLGWVFVHPPCVMERAADLDEVRTMIAGGELDAAIDELRWLLNGCSEMLEAHFLLGKLAIEADGDVALARGHFGVGYELGLKALSQASMPTPAPALHPANRPFYDVGRGLAWCLAELNRTDLAQEVIELLLHLDPRDGLNLRRWLDELHTRGKAFISLNDLSS